MNFNDKIMKLLEVGDKMYVRGSMSISNGSNDVAGGLATIKKIEIDENLGAEHMNGIMVKFEEITGHSYNYKNLMKDQEKLKEIYKDQFAHSDPDIDRPWIEEGDWANGQQYKGRPIW